MSTLAVRGVEGISYRTKTQVDHVSTIAKSNHQQRLIYLDLRSIDLSTCVSQTVLLLLHLTLKHDAHRPRLKNELVDQNTNQCQKKDHHLK